MRILWHSNAPWAPTGYGNQTALVASRLAADGHDVAISLNYGMQGGSTKWHGLKVYPMMIDQYGQDALVHHSMHHEADWTISLYDVWAFSSEPFTSWAQRNNLAAWTPVDHRPCPPAVLAWFHKTGAVPIAMSKYGARQLANGGLDPLYVPHGVDTSVFKPADDVAEARELFDIPQDAYVVLMNAANKGAQMRKGFWESIAAFAELARKRSDAVLYMHTEQFGQGMGVNLDEICRSVGLAEGQVRWINQYAYLTGSLPEEAMAKLYRASDVLLAPSKGEGFGIPVIEAQACGRPVIVSDFTAQPELVGDGWLVRGEPDWDAAQASCFFKPYVESVYECLEAAYARGRGDSAKAVEFIAGEYDADLVHATMWRPIIEQLAERAPTREPISIKVRGDSSGFADGMAGAKAALTEAQR